MYVGSWCGPIAPDVDDMSVSSCDSSFVGIKGDVSNVTCVVTLGPKD